MPQRDGAAIPLLTIQSQKIVLIPRHPRPLTFFPSFPLFLLQQPDQEDLKKEGRLQYFRSAAWLRSAITLAIIYILALSFLISLYRRLPPMDDLVARAAAAGDTQAATTLRLAIPHSIEELRAVRSTLEAYRQEYSSQVASLLIAAYLFLQTFMIPGPLGINILAGSLYPFWTAMLFTAVVSTLGASLNYWLVRCLLKDAVTTLFSSRVTAFQAEMRRHNTHLLNYMLFIRVTPVLPHWFVNLASPIVGVPFHIFLAATAIGHQPMNFITVQAGAALSSINNVSDLYSPRNVAFLMAVGVLALIPVVFKRRVRKGAKGLPRRQTLLNMLPIINQDKINGGIGMNRAGSESAV
jgi:uncharacterized membrane protein YdjX (TVP38/TMEM64 family)